MTLFEIQARDIRGPHTQYLYPWSHIGGVGRGLKGEPVSKWAGKQANKQTKKSRRGGRATCHSQWTQLEQGMQ